jgi:adenylate cyclase
VKGESATQDGSEHPEEVFMSYARPSATLAVAAAEVLRREGHTVWFDEALPGHGMFADVIEVKLTAAKAVLVLWSEDAVKSPWVRAEADLALKAGKLVQLSIDGAKPPLPFNQIQCLSAHGAADIFQAPAWAKVLGSIRTLIAGGESPVAGYHVAPLAVPTRPSIAVLPFENLARDPDEDYFAEGMLEEITNALSRIKSFFVIASASSRAIKAASLDHAGAAQALGVRYLLEGSVRKAAGRVRITVGLIDTSVGVRIWGDRFEDTLEDVFALQDRVSLAVAGVLEPAVRTAETLRALKRPTQTLGSYDLYLRAFSVYQSLDPEDVRQALALATQSIALDPRNASALCLAANCHGQALLVRWGDDKDMHRREGLDLAHRALRAAPDDPEVLARVGEALFNLGESLKTVADLTERAVALNPGSAHAHSVNGWMHVMLGDPQRAAGELRMALRLDPISADRALHLTGLAAALLCERRFEEAVDLAVQAAHIQPHAITNQVLLASCYGHLGDAAGAQKALATFKALNAGVAPRRWLNLYRDPQYHELALEGLERAEASVQADA